MIIFVGSFVFKQKQDAKNTFILFAATGFDSSNPYTDNTT